LYFVIVPVHLSEANIFLSISKTPLLNTVFFKKTVNKNTLEIPVCCVRIFRHKACLYIPLVNKVKHILFHWKKSTVDRDWRVLLWVKEGRIYLIPKKAVWSKPLD